MIDEVKDSLGRPNRRNSDAELVRETPEKSVSSNSLTVSGDGKGSVREAKFEIGRLAVGSSWAVCGLQPHSRELATAFLECPEGCAYFCF